MGKKWIQWGILIITVLGLFIIGGKSIHLTRFNTFMMFLLIFSFGAILGLYFTSKDREEG